MKAIRIHEFGGPEVMKLEDVERPVPAPDEILVKVYASGVNPIDCTIRNGGNDVLRPFLTLPMTLGWDAAGIVEETGSDVMRQSQSIMASMRSIRCLPDSVNLYSIKTGVLLYTLRSNKQVFEK